MSNSSSQQSPGQMEKKANAREDLVNLTSGAREKVDHAGANAQAAVTKLLHPFNAEAKKVADVKASETKAMASEKQATIRAIGQHQAAEHRMEAHGQMNQGNYEQDFRNGASTTSTGMPGTASTAERQPDGSAPAIGGTEDSAYSHIQAQGDSPQSTTPHKHVVPKGQSHELQTEDF